MFAIAAFSPQTAFGAGSAMVSDDKKGLVRPIPPKAMIKNLRPGDRDHRLHCSYGDVAELQPPDNPAKMAMRRLRVQPLVFKIEKQRSRALP